MMHQIWFCWLEHLFRVLTYAIIRITSIFIWQKYLIYWQLKYTILVYPGINGQLTIETGELMTPWMPRNGYLSHVSTYTEMWIPKTKVIIEPTIKESIRILMKFVLINRLGLMNMKISFIDRRRWHTGMNTQNPVYIWCCCHHNITKHTSIYCAFLVMRCVCVCSGVLCVIRETGFRSD